MMYVFCYCTIRKIWFRELGILRVKFNVNSLINWLPKDAAILRFAKAKGNFVGENIADADVRRKSIWISTCETDRPLSISEAAVSDINRRKLCHAFCITSPARRQSVRMKQNRFCAGGWSIVALSYSRVMYEIRGFKWKSFERDELIGVYKAGYWLIVKRPSREIIHSVFCCKNMVSRLLNNDNDCIM